MDGKLVQSTKSDWMIRPQLNLALALPKINKDVQSLWERIILLYFKLKVDQSEGNDLENKY